MQVRGGAHRMVIGINLYTAQPTLRTLPLTQVNPGMGNAHICIDGETDGILVIRWRQASECAVL